VLNLLPFLPLAGKAPLYARLLWSLASDARVPASRKALLGLAAEGYLEKAETGKYRWHFQAVRHDTWDFDFGAAPAGA